MTRHAPLAATLALCAALTPAVAAQETEAAAQPEPPRERVTNGQRFGAWAVTCEAIAVGETACVLSQRLVQSGGDAFLAEMLAFWSADGTESYVAVRVPNGVFFPSGFAIRAADAPEDAEQTMFEWQSCSPDLCEGLLRLDPEALEEFEGAGEVLAGYRPGLRAEPLVFRMSVSGLAEGLAALRR
ncbi:invasion associated locus B family protein [Roseisalinus antarcticus]|uniref:Invasion associated locus B (IalB) protein n=1 Tax=Roseisalinus antarcticus TaxID=254357 RepID=A0A1Y5RQ83_9RHOB|nr:invasion associated locus B family protein [Roseisalinus antarcticus]SLN22768.1 Invasion associated locus B (IalB) protein [Roseisalinus antarcticus]